MAVKIGLLTGWTVLLAACFAQRAAAQKKYDAGASDSEIKIGNISAYSGWGKAYGAVANAEAAYFRMVNDHGGVNGRKINFLSVDGESDPAKALELAKKLVEQDQVLLLFSPIGTESNLSIREYLNQKQVPQLFVESSSSAFNDPQRFPWTMGFFATYRQEGRAYADYLLRNRPKAKIGVLYANDEAGRDYLKGVHDGLGNSVATMIVKELAYEASDPDGIQRKILELRDSGSDVLLNFSVGPFSTQTIREAYDAGWHPLQFLPNASLSTAAFIEPAGAEKAKGIISNARSKSWLRPQDQNDPAVREFLDWMRKYNPDANLRDQNNVAGYERAQVLVEVLRRCGDDLTRANVMKQAASLDLELGMLRPGIRVHTTPEHYQPIHQLFLVQFDGHAWQPFGAVIGN